MPEEEVRITLRLPASLRDKLLSAARDRSRSMNGEIVARLENSEKVLRFLADFELLKEQNIRQEEHLKSLRKDVNKFFRLAKREQLTSYMLIKFMMKHLGVSEEEIVAITRPQSGK